MSVTFNLGTGVLSTTDKKWPRNCAVEGKSRIVKSEKNPGLQPRCSVAHWPCGFRQLTHPLSICFIWDRRITTTTSRDWWEKWVNNKCERLCPAWSEPFMNDCSHSRLHSDHRCHLGMKSSAQWQWRSDWHAHAGSRVAEWGSALRTACALTDQETKEVFSNIYTLFPYMGNGFSSNVSSFHYKNLCFQNAMALALWGTSQR